MQALHSIVLLYKSWGQSSFSLLSPEFHALETGLGYVKLTDVDFPVFPDKVVPGTKTVHAVARGSLTGAYPEGIKPPSISLTQLQTWPQIDYNPNSSPLSFRLVGTGGPITKAKTLLAYQGRVVVEI